MHGLLRKQLELPVAPRRGRWRVAVVQQFLQSGEGRLALGQARERLHHPGNVQESSRIGNRLEFVLR